MITSVADERVEGVRITDRDLVVTLADGRTLSVPLDWYPRLLNASPEQRNDWELIGRGAAISWPQIDEDLSVAGLLRAVPAPDANIQSSPTETPEEWRAGGVTKIEEAGSSGETEGSPPGYVRAALEQISGQANSVMQGNTQLAQESMRGSMQQVQQQAQVLQQAGRVLSEQAQIMRPIQSLVQESANAYADVLKTATQAWMQVAQHSVQAAGEVAQRSIQAASQAAQQATQDAAQSGGESASAAKQPAQRSATSPS